VGIPPAPRGVPQIEVTFDIDANGIVNVSAKDKASGREQAIRIQASGGLSEADIQRMVREAEAHAEEDKRRKELVEARNQADAVVYTVDKLLKDAGERVPPNVRSEVEQSISAAREAIKGEDIQRLRQVIERLQQVSGRLNEAAAQAGTQAGAEGTRPGTGSDNVVDAEFEDVDDRSRKAG
jgi:molecular chaperone DnaK